MPKEILVINDLSKGINTEFDSKDILDTQLIQCHNVVTDMVGKLKPIEAYKIPFDFLGGLSVLLNANTNVLYFSTDYDKNGYSNKTDWIAYQYNNTKIRIAWRDTDGNFNLVNSSYYLEYTFLKNGIFKFAYANGFLFITDSTFENDTVIFGKASNSHFYGTVAQYSSTIVNFSKLEFDIFGLMQPASFNASGNVADLFVIINGIKFSAKSPYSYEIKDYAIVWDCNKTIENGHISIHKLSKTIWIIPPRYCLNDNVTSITIDSQTYDYINFCEWFNKHKSDANNLIEASVPSGEGIPNNVRNFETYNGYNNYAELREFVIKNQSTFSFISFNDKSAVNYRIMDSQIYSSTIDRLNVLNTIENWNKFTDFNETYFKDRFSIINGTSVANKLDTTLTNYSNTYSISVSGLEGVPINIIPLSYNHKKSFVLRISVVEELGNPLPEGTYVFGYTVLLKNKQEVSFNEIINSVTIPPNKAFFAELFFNIRESNSALIDDQKYDLLIDSFKFYMKKIEDSEWLFVSRVSLKDGSYDKDDVFNAGYIEVYSELTGNENENIIYTSFNIKQESYSTLRYEAGFSEKDSLQSKYKSSVFANNRLFAVNIKDENEDLYPDRILISNSRNPFTLPSNNFIDISNEDGDEYITISHFSSRILAFKKKNLYIINITSNDPSTFYLEQTVFNAGVESHYSVCETEFGIAWFNKNGIYIYDGKAVNEITEGKIKGEYISNYDTYNVKRVGYDFFEKKLIITFQKLNDSYSYVFDFKNSAFNTIVFANATYATNFFSIGGRAVMFISSDIHEYTESINSTRSVIVETKKYDFGQPHVRKKIRRFYVHFSGTYTSAINFSYRLDDTNDYTEITGTVVEGNLILFDLPSSLTCYTVQIKMSGIITIEINDISIIYRRKLPK